MEIYSQVQDTHLEPPEPRLFWNTRGRAVEIRDERIISQALKRGFVPCDETVKVGQYNPVFDKGGIEGVSYSVDGKKDLRGELTLTVV